MPDWQIALWAWSGLKLLIGLGVAAVGSLPVDPTPPMDPPAIERSVEALESPVL